ncbi:hypothetical protein ACEPAF_1298 [Sanghuangporus sanghuang]
MIHDVKDAAPVSVDQQATMAEYGREKTSFEESSELVYTIKYVSAIEILNAHNIYSASLTVLPPWVWPLVRLLPWYANGDKAVEDLAGMAVAAVAKRLVSPKDRFLIADSVSVSNSLCAITYYLAANPLVQAKLQKELDEALGVNSSDDPVTTFSRVKNLPYLGAVINETMPVHSTAGFGLLASFPKADLRVHRDPDVWEVDADVFRPERWFELRPVRLQKSFHPFSFGLRACVG